MRNNIYGSSAAPSSYYSEANDHASAPSELGSGASLNLLGNASAPYFQDLTAYSQWSAGSRQSRTSSGASYGSADNRSFHERSSVDSDAWSHLSPSSASTSTVSDFSHALSEAGSRRSSGGHLSSHSSERSLNSHQNRLPSLSDGSAQGSLTGSDLAAIEAARESGRFFSGHSELGSVASGWGYNEGRSSRSGRPQGSGNGSRRLSTVAESLSDAGGSSTSSDRAELLERLNRLRDGISIPAGLVSEWHPDTELTVSDLSLSTSVSEAGPPSRPAPRLRRNAGDSGYGSSATTSSSHSSVPPRVHGPAIYGRSTLGRAMDTINPKRWR